MAVTKKVQAEAEQRRISQIGDFKNRMGGIIELPSGLIIKWRNPGGMAAFIQSGSIPNSLMPIIQKALDEGKAPTANELMPGGKLDAKMLNDMTEMLDSIVVSCFVEPKIHPRLTDQDVIDWNKEHPDEPVTDKEDLRDEDTLYADEIPDDDKNFLFNVINGGTKDLEEFRRQQELNLVAMASQSKSKKITK